MVASQAPTSAPVQCDLRGTDDKTAGLGTPGSSLWDSVSSNIVKRRPHKAADSAYLALCEIERQHGSVKLEDFRKIAQLGSGDVGVVWLVQLQGHGHFFAMKTLEKRKMEERKKVQRVLTEVQILSHLDHPFLASLYCTIQTDTHLHFVLEYCECGGMHGLLQTQWRNQFEECHVRFYAAEVLLALQYLHLHGFVYRDLKPENILLRSSGHIVLTDFDLSYAKCTTTPVLQAQGAQRTKSLGRVNTFKSLRSFRRIKSMASFDTRSDRKSSKKHQSLPNPLELHAGTYQDTTAPRRKKEKSASKAAQDQKPAPPTPEWLFVAQPEGRANSLVGTEEYLAPEVIHANGHTAAVDWWSFGILLHELLYGFTPFRASSRDLTFDNILHQTLRFPTAPAVSEECQDLMRRLLERDPSKRLGSKAGAEEVKAHPFFASVNWALLLHQKPPHVMELTTQVCTKDSALASMTTSCSMGTGSSCGSAGLVESPGSSTSSLFSNF